MIGADVFALRTGTLRSVALGLSATALLAGCGNDEPTAHLRAFSIFTHCGVGTTDIGGVTYYPTAIYANGELVAGGEGAVVTGDGGPMPWIQNDGLATVYPEQVVDPNYTYGTILVPGDGTAEFAVNDGIHTISYSTDADDAAWIIEACY